MYKCWNWEGTKCLLKHPWGFRIIPLYSNQISYFLFWHIHIRCFISLFGDLFSLLKPSCDPTIYTISIEWSLFLYFVLLFTSSMRSTMLSLPFFLKWCKIKWDNWLESERVSNKKGEFVIDFVQAYDLLVFITWYSTYKVWKLCSNRYKCNECNKNRLLLE